jgi:hypothetical protein
MKKDDSNNIILWGTTTFIPTESEKVVQVGFKDQAFVLGMSIIQDVKNTILRSRKKPSTTFISAKTTRVLFGED